MATSSITKQFVVKDRAVFEKLKKEAEKIPARTVVADASTSLNRGREKLKQFLPR